MASINDEQLKAQIKEGKASGAYMFYGEETYLKQQYVALMKRKLIDPSFEDFNFHSFEGKDTTLDEILMSADIMPMMSEHSMTLVHDYPLLRAPTDLDKLESYLKEIPPETVLVFWFDAIAIEDNGKKTTAWDKVIKRFSKYGNAVLFEQKTPAQLAQRLVAYAGRKKVKLNTSRAHLMVETVGSDMQTLMTELDKIIAYVGEGGEITKKEIELLATPSLETNIFKLSDHILKGDSTAAFALLDALLTQKTEPMDIIGRLTDCYIDMYRAKCARTEGVGEAQVAADFGYSERLKWKIGKAAANASSYSLQTLRKALDVLARSDELLKSSPVDNRILLEEMLSKLLILRNR